MASKWVLILALMAFAAVTARATTFLQLQSTSLGDGWFQYQLHVMNDPFFTEADIVDLQIHFPGEDDHSTTSGSWTNADYDAVNSTWGFVSNNPARPWAETFLIHSPLPAYRMGTNATADGALVIVSLYLSEFYPNYSPGVFSMNVVGYAGFPCLIPCPAEEADGSPTNFVYDLKLLPDVNIDHLIMDAGKLTGVDFDYNQESTFLLQGSADLSHWTDVAYIWSTPPETVWTTNQDLSVYGQFFRVSIVAGQHTSNLPPLNSQALLKPKIVAKIATKSSLPTPVISKVAAGKITVTVATQTNQVCDVQAVDSQLIVRQTRRVTATGTSTPVQFDVATLPNPVFFRVATVQ